MLEILNELDTLVNNFLQDANSFLEEYKEKFTYNENDSAEVLKYETT